VSIDTVVVLMMENRSFDHYLGWLGDDDVYLDEGRRRHGRDFRINASIKEQYRNPFGQIEFTRASSELGDDPSPYRGCNHRDPGHNWTTGRVQRDLGFLASCTDSDNFATATT
jgi:phospholipase C